MALIEKCLQCTFIFQQAGIKIWHTAKEVFVMIALAHMASAL